MTPDSSPLSDHSWRAWALARAPGTLLLVWTFLCCCQPAHDYDFWWHLKTGELIWQTGTIPQTDWYTFTCSQERWIDLHWGFQLGLAAIYHLGGINLVILVKAAVITAAVAVAKSATSRGLDPALSALMWLLPVISISGRAFERPEVLSLLFLAAWLWILDRGPSRPGLLWLLPPLQLVWTNCHALFVLGLVVGGCALAGAALRAFLRQGVQAGDGRPRRDRQRSRSGPHGDSRRDAVSIESPRDRSAVAGPSRRTVLCVAGLTVLACFVNPYFHEGALFPLVLFRKLSVDQPFYSRYIAEFGRPIDFLSAYGFSGMLNLYFLAQAGWLLATALSFVWLVRAGSWNYPRMLLFAAFAFLAFQAGRNVNICALVFGVVAAANVGEVAAIMPRWRFLLAAPLGAPHRFPAASWTAGLFLLLSLAVVTRMGQTVASSGGIWGRVLGDQFTKAFGFGERPNWFAHEACLFAGQPGFPRRAFISHLGLAGVYEYHHARDRLVYMDPRLEVCSRQVFELFLERLRLMSLADPRWEQGLRDENGELPAVILDNRESRVAIQGLRKQRRWRMVYADPAAVVFLETAQADRLGLPEATSFFP